MKYKKTKRQAQDGLGITMKWCLAGVVVFALFIGLGAPCSQNRSRDHTLDIGLRSGSSGDASTEAIAPTSFDTIDETVTTPAVGHHTAMALDSENCVHISYYDASNWDLKYATNASGAWETEAVDETGNVGMYSSIAIGLDDAVHISYYDTTNTKLKYATRDASKTPYWTIEEDIDNTADVGQYTSIAIDSSDKAHISYYDVDNHNLRYATNASDSWVPENAATGTDVGQYSAIALDANDVVHISFYDADTDDLCYVVGSTGSFTDPLALDEAGNVGQYTDIAVNQSDGKVHISYYDVTELALYWVVSETGAWADPSKIDDSTTDVGQYTSIGLDALGQVHISYYDNQYDDLRYATNLDGTEMVPWSIAAIDYSGDMGQYTNLAVDMDGAVHISYYDYDTPAIKYVTRLQPPAAPSDFDANGAGAGKIELTWSDQSANEDGFTIYRRIGGGTWSELTSLGIDETTYTDEGLTVEWTYYYRIRAFKGDAKSAYSDIESFVAQ